MKFYQYLLLTGFWVSMLVGCSQEESIVPTISGNMIIRVSDAGMVNSDNKTASRAVTNDVYNTIFEENDAIGLFAVNDATNEVLDDFNNVKVEYANGMWNSTLRYDNTQGGLTYYAYYPYQDGVTIDLDKEDVFEALVTGWNPESMDQSTKEGYAGADLMTSKATKVVKEASGQYALQLDLTHRMALSVMIAPETEYEFTDSELNKIPYIIRGGEVTFTINNAAIQPYEAVSGEYRMIVKPATSRTIVGMQDDKQYTIPAVVTEGKYKRFLLGGGKSKVTHNLQVGDFYCSDGRIVAASKEAPEDCIGVVYYVGNVRPSALYEDLTDNSGKVVATATEENDVLLQNYPSCVHGLVCAVTSANATAVSRFCSSGKYDYPVKVKDFFLDAKYLYVGAGKTWVPEYLLGYNNTVILQELAKDDASGSDAMFPNRDNYEEAYPAPIVTTGWFCPSFGDFKVMFDNQSALTASLDKGGFEKLWSNPAGADETAETYAGYWTSTVRGKGYMVGARNNNGTFAYYMEKDTKVSSGYFRFALAF